MDDQGDGEDAVEDRVDGGYSGRADEGDEGGRESALKAPVVRSVRLVGGLEGGRVGVSSSGVGLRQIGSKGDGAYREDDGVVNGSEDI